MKTCSLKIVAALLALSAMLFIAGCENSSPEEQQKKNQAEEVFLQISKQARKGDLIRLDDGEVLLVQGAGEGYLRVKQKLFTAGILDLEQGSAEGYKFGRNTILATPTDCGRYVAFAQQFFGAGMKKQ